MKVFTSIIILIFIVITSHGQQANWDSTYRPDGYDLRLAQFSMFPHSKKDIIFLGNSITAGVEWQELLGNPHVRNRGISGDIETSCFFDHHPYVPIFLSPVHLLFPEE